MQTVSPRIRRQIIFSLLGIFLVLGFAGMFLPATISWDGSVYAGMGKFLFSHGASGLWETLRPVGFPIVLGAFWKIGIDPYLAGRALALLGSLGVLFFSYKIAERLHEGAGPFAAVLIASTPLFFSYATVPMTDIISGAFALASLWYALGAGTGKKIFFSGLLAGLAFLFRFPEGLAFAVSGAVIALRAWQAPEGIRSKAFLRNACLYALGFALVAVPFFAANFFAYHDPLLPLKAGSGIITGHVSSQYLHPASFYLHVLADNSAYVLLALLPLAAFLMFRKYRASVPWIASVLFLFSFFLYFSHLAHKEMRYALAFLPMAFVFAGIGISMVLDQIGKRYVSVAFLLLLAAAGAYADILFLRQSVKNDGVYARVGESLAAYGSETGSTARVLASSPFLASVSDAKIADTLYDDWRGVLPAYEKDKGTITHVLIDTCTLEAACSSDAGCVSGKAEAEAVFARDAAVAVDGTAGMCHVTLYRLK